MNQDLEDAINQLTEKLSLSDLAKARDALTAKYRDSTRHGKAKLFMTSDLERLSYLVTRLPATYGAVSAVLEAVKNRIPDLVIHSMLDLGAGPGTAFFALSDHFPELKTATLIEQDAELIRLGKALQSEREAQDINITWNVGDITNLNLSDTYDLCILSYAMNELEKEERCKLIEKAYAATKNLLIIVEPGSREGFSLIKDARAQLIESGAIIVAPCPHSFACPMPKDDWCHFSARISRTSAHRLLKQGALGYEDEKFSYVAVSKFDSELPNARIIRYPEKHSGHLKLKLCTKQDGLIEKTISKRDKELYKKARKLEWGDTL